VAELLIGFIDVVSPMVAEVLSEETPPGMRLELLVQNTAQARLDLARRADVLLAWAGPIHGGEIEASPRLLLVQKTGQGVDNVDLEAATRRGVPVCNGGGANAATVAEFTILLMLALARRLRTLESEVRNGGWPNFAYRDISFDLMGKTVGIVGLGNIGKNVARRLRGWECEVLYYDIVRPSPEQEAALGVTFVPLDTLLRQVDVLTLHVSLNPSTYHLIGARELALLRPGAVLVNASRGPVVDEPALIAALERGKLAGAALDVVEQEPIDLDNPLLRMPNVVLTPHAAAGTRDCVRRMVRSAMANIARVAAGEPPRNVQNGVEGPVPRATPRPG